MELREIRQIALENANQVVDNNFQEICDACKRVISYAHLCNAEGNLALQMKLEFLPNEIPLSESLCEMMSMVTDGMEEQQIKELLNIKFLVNNYTGRDAFLYYLYAKSMLMIQQGIAAVQLEQFCNILIPDAVKSKRKICGDVFHEQYDIKMEQNKEQMMQLRAECSEQEKMLLEKATTVLEELTQEEWKILTGTNGFSGWEQLVCYGKEDMRKLIRSHLNRRRYEAILAGQYFVKELNARQLVRELEDCVKKVRMCHEISDPLDRILLCTETEIQKIIQEIDKRELAVALKGTKEEIREFIYKYLSVREKYEVKEWMEYMGPLRRCDVESVQAKILLIIDQFPVVR